MLRPNIRNFRRINRARLHSSILYPVRVQARNYFISRVSRLPCQRWSARLSTFIFSSYLLYILYLNDCTGNLAPTHFRQAKSKEAKPQQDEATELEKISSDNINKLAISTDDIVTSSSSAESAWEPFLTKFSIFSVVAEIEWSAITNTVTDYMWPEWAKLLPEQIGKLKKELSMAPGSLADDIWREARDPYINPEIQYNASVRVSEDLCDQEKVFLARRRKFTRIALANYLNIPLEEVHPDDVPTIAVIGSGGGLRAVVSGAGSMLASEKDGLLDCVTYTAGVSGSCWLQALFNTSIGQQNLEKIISHLKARIGIHIAYPPVALEAVNTAPTNKYLISGFIEKLKGDLESDFGLVDLYGLLLGARLLVPKGELAVKESDLKISNQRQYIEHGQYPMPIYTVVRHQIPILQECSDTEKSTSNPSEETKLKAKKESWFQWFEISPYEMFCEEFGAGIPTWAMGRKFEGGKNIPFGDDILHPPELRLPLLLGIFGSAFCATLSHYYREIRSSFQGLAGFGNLDEMIEGHNESLSKVHPIDPAYIPNFAYKMGGKLPETVPEEIFSMRHLQLMDAGMSNNLPVYPLLRPGRHVEILIAFDASADIKTGNWLSVADGYALQRGIKGWPVGAGWPKKQDSIEKTADILNKMQAKTASEAQEKLEDAQKRQEAQPEDSEPPKDRILNEKNENSKDELGYCTIWVGRTEERSSSTERVKSKAVEEDWELMEPDAGIAVIYFPLLSNPSVKDVDPVTCDYMSTWNFVYTPEEIENVVTLAKTNFDAGKEKTKRCVRAVYERKKNKRKKKEAADKEIRWRHKVRLGTVGKKGEGDHFYLT